MKVSSHNFARRRRSQSGQSVVDYLMVTIVIAAVAIPILNNLFGDAIVGSLFSQRQRPVDFIAQTPKRPVPNIWFSAEKQADPGGQGDVGGGQDLKDPDNIGDQKDLNAPSDVGGTGEIKNPRSIGGQRDIKVGTIGAGGSAGGGGNVGGGGGNGTGGGGGSGNNGGGSSLSGDEFFGGGGGSKGGKGEGSGDGGGGGKNSFNRGGGISNEEGGSTGGGRGGGGGKKEDKGGGGGGEGGEDKGGGFSGKKAEAQGVARAVEQDQRRSSEFDWWFLIKFLIVCLIVFLLGLIALSNLKKR